MLTLERGRVTAVLGRRVGLVRLEVDGRPCIAYPRLTGPVAVGDDVVVNTQAVELGLGSGGWDILHVNLTRGLGRPPEPGAHVMKLPYTSVQAAVRHAEEGRELPEALVGLPVVGCTLHSQVAPVCAGIGADGRAAYLQVEGGALPVSISDTLHALRERGLLSLTVAVGACVDADVACVSTASALAFAASEGCRVAVCAIGPGLAGTGTALGHGAVRVAEALAVARALGGAPVVAPRVSFADARERHRGLSHHTRTVLAVCPDAVLPWPQGLEPPAGIAVTAVDTAGWEAACAGLPLSSMGRDPGDDPWFFAASFGAGRVAAKMTP